MTSQVSFVRGTKEKAKGKVINSGNIFFELNEDKEITNIKIGDGVSIYEELPGLAIVRESKEERDRKRGFNDKGEVVW